MFSRQSTGESAREKLLHRSVVLDEPVSTLDSHNMDREKDAVRSTLTTKYACRISEVYVRYSYVRSYIVGSSVGGTNM